VAAAHEAGNGKAQFAFLANDDSLDVADDPFCYDLWFFHVPAPRLFNEK
jgi:hypothetical protein